MMKKKIFFALSAFVLILLVAGTAKVSNAQKIIEGNLDFLKGQTSLNVVFDFTNFMIERDTEAEYLAKEVEAKNAKEAGSGDKWKERWEKDKNEIYKQAFIETMKKRLSIPLDDPKAKYTLIVYNINMTDKGWGNKFAGHPSNMEVDYKFVETADLNKFICKLREERATYLSTSGTMSNRIQGLFEYCGYQMAKSIFKNL